MYFEVNFYFLWLDLTFPKLFWVFFMKRRRASSLRGLRVVWPREQRVASQRTVKYQDWHLKCCKPSNISQRRHSLTATFISQAFLPPSRKFQEKAFPINICRDEDCFLLGAQNKLFNLIRLWRLCDTRLARISLNFSWNFLSEWLKTNEIRRKLSAKFKRERIPRSVDMIDADSRGNQLCGRRRHLSSILDR